MFPDLEEPVEGLSDQRPSHGAPRQRQAARLVPGQAPAEAPQLPGQNQQQQGGQQRGERGGQGRKDPELSQGEHLLRWRSKSQHPPARAHVETESGGGAWSVSLPGGFPPK